MLFICLFSDTRCLFVYFQIHVVYFRIHVVYLFIFRYMLFICLFSGTCCLFVYFQTHAVCLFVYFKIHVVYFQIHVVCLFTFRYTLLKLVQKFGELEKFDFLYHKFGPDKGKPRGYCFVNFKNKQVSICGVQITTGSVNTNIQQRTLLTDMMLKEFGYSD